MRLVTSGVFCSRSCLLPAASHTILPRGRSNAVQFKRLKEWPCKYWSSAGRVLGCAVMEGVSALLACERQARVSHVTIDPGP
eukprot:scaffold220359_cov19-Tisochrysis_lutea.AAC.4